MKIMQLISRRSINYVVYIIIVLGSIVGNALNAQENVDPNIKVNIQQQLFANGSKLLLVTEREIPIIDLDVYFAAGSAYSPLHPGVASLTGNMLSEGTANYTAQQLAEKMEAAGIQFTTAVNRDMAGVHLRLLNDHTTVQLAIKLLVELLSTANFPAENFARVQQQTLQYINEELQDPGYVAQTNFLQAVYGDHPYALAPEGTVDTVNAITREMCVDFYKRYYVTQNMVVTMVGAIDFTTAQEIVETLDKKLMHGNQAEPLPAVKPLTTAVVKKIKFPSTQTHILLGSSAITQHAPDFYAFFVGNEILGGHNLTTKLFKQVRIANGLAYSVNSYVLPLQQPGPFVVRMQTRNDKANDALKLSVQELDMFVKDGPSSADLQHGITNIVRGLPLRISSNQQIAAYLQTIGFYNLPLTYLTDFKHHIEQVTTQEVHDSFVQHIHPDKLVTVMVGDFTDNA